ncbi:MAG TPA: ion transporter [Candidatus Brocadiia bacterium]|nr:ion transporter [Candidatus Brocadiia bacterium]
MSVRRRLYQVLLPRNEADPVSRWFNFSILILICLNMLFIILESVRALRGSLGAFFDTFEHISVTVFALEYVARLWTCVENPRFARPVVGRLRMAFSPLLIIDLLAILPFYLPFTGLDLRALWTLRLFRLFRVAKLFRYSRALQTLTRVLWKSRSELAAATFAMLLLVILSATLMYHAENDEQPEKFSSIPASMWWAVATLTTIGYGDICPVTPLGKLLGSFIMILGVGMFAIPTGILGAGFVEEFRGRRLQAHTCPRCGKRFLKDGAPTTVDRGGAR